MNTEIEKPLLAIGIYKSAHDEPIYCIAFVGYKDGKTALLAEPRYQRNSLDRSVFHSDQGIYTTAKQAEKQLSDDEVNWILSYAETGNGSPDLPIWLLSVTSASAAYAFPDRRLTENQVLASKLADDSKIQLSSQPEVAAVTAAILALKGELDVTEDEDGN